jgi:hypothetical protein
MVSAILMIACGVLALFVRNVANPTFINATLLSGLLLYVGLLLTFFGLIAALVAFVKDPNQD